MNSGLANGGHAKNSTAATEYRYFGPSPRAEIARASAFPVVTCSPIGVASSWILASALAADSKPVSVSPTFSEVGLSFYTESQFDHSRRRAAIALLDEWLCDESGYDEETWPRLKRALDEDRLSARRLFDA